MKKELQLTSSNIFGGYKLSLFFDFTEALFLERIKPAKPSVPDTSLWSEERATAINGAVSGSANGTGLVGAF